MKTLRNFRQKAMMIMAGMAMVMGLTSCEGVWIEPAYGPAHMDYNQSKALSGQWTGNFGMYYSYNGRYYDADFTDVVFYPDYYGATRGYGKQVDWYAYGPYEYIYHKFNWELRDGIVDLFYYHDTDLNTFIRDYKMTNDYFSGYFGNSSDGFRLRKISDYYNWTPYVNTYSYGNRRDWCEARQMFELSDSTDARQAFDASQEGNDQIKFGNRFLESAQK